MAKGKIIGKVKRPPKSLVYVDKDGDVRAIPIGKRKKKK